MKSKLGLTASFVALGGACVVTTACATSGGPDSPSFAGKEFDVCRDIDNSTEASEGIKGLELTVNLGAAVERAEDCRQWYYSVAGLVTAADTTQAGIASGGGLGLLAGGAAASTNVFLATLVVGPEVFREVARQEPQGVLAYQAAQATTLAECQLVRVREGLHDLVDDRLVLRSAISNAYEQRTALTTAIEKFVNVEIPKYFPKPTSPEQGSAAIPVAPIPFGQLVAQNVELKELVGLARRYDDLIAEGERLLYEVDALTTYIEPEPVTLDPSATPAMFEVAKALAAEDALKRAKARIDERLAMDLNTKVDAINQIWSNNFRQLTPTPQASLRGVLAAPFSFTAKLIAGEESKPGNAEQVARATYDFSGSYGSHGVKALSIPTVVVAVDKAVLHPANWTDVDNSLDGMRALSSAMSRSNALLNYIAHVDADAAGGSCQLTSSANQPRTPLAPSPTQSPDSQQVLVMAKN